MIQALLILTGEQMFRYVTSGLYVELCAISTRYVPKYHTLGKAGAESNCSPDPPGYRFSEGYKILGDFFFGNATFLFKVSEWQNEL